jgi:hypothetical protein
MCFGETWSKVSFITTLLSGTIGLYYQIDIRIIVGAYFIAIKEFIQYLLYKYLDTCNDVNKWLSVAAWIHISWQPFFVNLFASAFAPNKQNEYNIVLSLCIVFAIINMTRIRELSIFFKDEDICDNKGDTNKLCQNKTCSIEGQYHLAYGFKLISADTNVYTPSIFMHLFLMFIPAMILGPRSIALVNGIIAILPGLFIIKSGEVAAVWCVNAMVLMIFTLYAILFCNKGCTLW